MLLFTPVRFRQLDLPNRVVWPPMVSWEATEDGQVTDRLVERYRRRAAGGAGFVIMEATGVNASKSPFLPRIYDDRYLPGLARLVEAVHREGARVSVQLIHFLRASKSGWREKVEDLSAEDIARLQDDFAAAARRAKAAGFDAIELHAAHYYTLASFLSRLNNRQDAYGGTFAGRFRLLEEVYRRCREAVGADFCVGMRLNGDEFVLGGNTLKQSVQVARRAAEMGIDYISVSAGGKAEDGPWYTGYSGSRAMPPDYMPVAVNVYLAEAIRQAVQPLGVPVITAGRIPTAEVAESLLQEGKADLIGVCRPLLADPDWPRKYREGRERDIFRCRYCNECLERDRRLEPVECLEREKAAAAGRLREEE